MDKALPPDSRIGLIKVIALVNLLLALILCGVLWLSYQQGAAVQATSARVRSRVYTGPSQRPDQ